MTLPLSSARAYLGIRPQRFQDAVRLYVAYAVAVVLKAIRPRTDRSVGVLVGGQRNLHVIVDGIQVQVRPRTNDLDLLSPKHEPQTTDWFRIRNDDVVVDVGAHIGRYTLIAARKGAKVIAIEPDPSNFALLRTNVIANRLSNVVLVPQAMTSRPKTLWLSLADSTNTGTSSVGPDGITDPSHVRGRREVQVRGETLDRLVESLKLDRIDWLKIDVEGHEVAVLEGGGIALGITRRLALEVSDRTIDRCMQIVEARGFRLHAIEAGDPARNLLFAKNGP